MTLKAVNKMTKFELKTLNKFLLDNQEYIEVVFTKIYGKYLMRYYDEAKDYTLSFSYYEETSYCDNRNKNIVIALENVRKLLALNVPVLSIAYHELAHTIYTNTATKKDIIRKALKALGYENYTAQERAQAIWNILEDQYIERQLAIDYPFLAPIIKPITKILVGDGKLFSWRKNEPIDKDLYDLVQPFAESRLTNIRSGQIIAKVIEKYYPIVDHSELEEETQPYEDENEEERDDYEEAQDEQEQSQDEQEQSQDGVVDEDVDKKSFDGEAEQDEDIEEQGYGSSVNDDDMDTEETYEERDKPKTLGEIIEDLEAHHEDLGVISILENVLEEKKQMDFRRRLERAIEKHKKPKREYNQRVITPFYNAKQFIRNGMSQAQTKGYSANPSHRVSVNRIIEAQTSRQAPNVFYGRGKDIGFLRKVVIFEDVSYSARGVTPIFSHIAKTLSLAFEANEWWLYGKKLYQRADEDKKYFSFQDGDQIELANSTNTDYLGVLMESRKNEDNIYVVITDGDMRSIIRDEKLMEKYHDKMVVVGLLDKQTKEAFPYNYSFSEEFTKFGNEVPSVYMSNLYQHKDYQKMVIRAVQEVVRLIKERLQ